MARLVPAQSKHPVRFDEIAQLSMSRLNDQAKHRGIVPHRFRAISNDY